MTMIRFGLCLALVGLAMAVLVPLWMFSIVGFDGNGTGYEAVLYLGFAFVGAISGVILNLIGLMTAFVGTSRRFRKDSGCNETATPETE